MLPHASPKRRHMMADSERSASELNNLKEDIHIKSAKGSQRGSRRSGDRA